jgi:hypothetical protein
MRLALAVSTIVLSVVPLTSGRSQAANTAPLRGGPPSAYNVLPPLPPNGFYAWCETSRGVCPVRGNAPISPGSLCHCADYAGRTV